MKFFLLICQCLLLLVSSSEVVASEKGSGALSEQLSCKDGSRISQRLSDLIASLELASIVITTNATTNKEYFIQQYIYMFDDILKLLHSVENSNCINFLLTKKSMARLTLILNYLGGQTEQSKTKLVYTIPRFFVVRWMQFMREKMSDGHFLVSLAKRSTALLFVKSIECSITSGVGALRLMQENGLLAPHEIRDGYKALSKLAYKFCPNLREDIAITITEQLDSARMEYAIETLPELLDTLIEPKAVLEIAHSTTLRLLINHDLARLSDKNDVLPVMLKMLDHLGNTSIELIINGKYRETIKVIELYDYIITELSQKNLTKVQQNKIIEKEKKYLELSKLYKAQKSLDAINRTPYEVMPADKAQHCLLEALHTIDQHLSLLCVGQSDSIVRTNLADALPSDSDQFKLLLVKIENPIDRSNIAQAFELAKVWQKLIHGYPDFRIKDNNRNSISSSTVMDLIQAHMAYINNILVSADYDIFSNSSQQLAWKSQSAYFSDVLADFVNNSTDNQQTASMCKQELENGEIAQEDNFLHKLIFLRQFAMQESKDFISTPMLRAKLLVSYIETLVLSNSSLSSTDSEKFKYFRPHHDHLPFLLKHLGALLEDNYDIDINLITNITNMAIAILVAGNSVAKMELGRLFEVLKSNTKPLTFSYEVFATNRRSTLVEQFCKLALSVPASSYFTARCDNSKNCVIVVDIKKTLVEQAKDILNDIEAGSILINSLIVSDEVFYVFSNSQMCGMVFNNISKTKIPGVTIDKIAGSPKIKFGIIGARFVANNLRDILDLVKKVKELCSPKIYLQQPIEHKDSEFFVQTISTGDINCINHAKKIPIKIPNLATNKYDSDKRGGQLGRVFDSDTKTKKKKIPAPQKHTQNAVVPKESFAKKIERERQETIRKKEEERQHLWKKEEIELSNQKPTTIAITLLPSKKTETLVEAIESPEDLTLLRSLMDHALTQMSDLFGDALDTRDLFYSLYGPMLILCDIMYRYIDELINAKTGNIFFAELSKSQLYMFKWMRDKFLKDIAQYEHSNKWMIEFNVFAKFLHSQLGIVYGCIKDRAHNVQSTVTFKVEWESIEKEIKFLEAMPDTKNNLFPLDFMHEFWSLSDKASLKARGLVAMAGVVVEDVDAISNMDKLLLRVRAFRNDLAHAKILPEKLEKSLNKRLKQFAGAKKTYLK